ncbi:tol-pal system-associated acyl-CoA thioesterase [Acinetobacter rathckeae]|uniref:tol-pal system-associated acyl-CoA thioesterase n=1 Tax=Acinetobacter rathckeae TaxID=2605272 RepID=UPI0018A27C13|nr:tol-pal system-associated acyl-CoA thioesterase [Acinetobacter rathckeae]MBF7687521.1 tol-pal system-associated acyl-CoA thioesterase [Acinetobacter rathckeae]MBF7694923.1 tol-pal system-associated acyl-CoA thioesterase [Acinetobacter rathckeae]
MSQLSQHPDNNNTFWFPVRVYIEDTDAGGIVYHANHLSFMERARTEWLRASGVAHYWHQTDYSFVVRHVDLKYLKPILMDDLVHVGVEVICCKSASLVLQQNIYRGEILLVTGKVELACLNANMAPCRLPQEIKAISQPPVKQN